MVLNRHQKVIMKGKKSSDIGEPRRVNHKNMTSHVQIGGEDGENEYEKLRDFNIRRNAMVLKKLGLPPFEGSCKERTTLKTNVEETYDAPSEADIETSPFQMACCWSCKIRLVSASSSYCCYCGARQSAGGIDLQVQVQGSGGAESHLQAQGPGGAESQGKLFSSHSSDFQVNGPSISDRQLSYERVFHPRPRRMADNKQLWGKQFLKKYYPRQHEKLNLIHGDVRHWFSNTKDPLVDEFFKHPSIRHDGPFMKRLTEFVKARELELSTLVFIEESVTMRWKVEDILKYAFEIKHYKRKQS